MTCSRACALVACLGFRIRTFRPIVDHFDFEKRTLLKKNSCKVVYLTLGLDQLNVFRWFQNSLRMVYALSLRTLAEA